MNFSGAFCFSVISCSDLHENLYANFDNGMIEILNKSKVVSMTNPRSFRKRGFGFSFTDVFSLSVFSYSIHVFSLVASVVGLVTNVLAILSFKKKSKQVQVEAKAKRERVKAPRESESDEASRSASEKKAKDDLSLDSAEVLPFFRCFSKI